MTERTLVTPSRDPVSGLVIAIAAVSSVAMMSHHPHVAAHEIEAVFAEATRQAFAIRFVHATLIGVTVLLAFGYSGFALRLGLDRPLVRLGLVTYLFGCAAMIGAGVINGLAFPEMVERFADEPLEAKERAAAVLTYGWVLNQAIAAVGLLAWSAAVLAWSLALARLSGAWRWIGIAGIAIGALGALAFLSGHLRLDVHGFGLFVLVQALWSVAVGVRLSLRSGNA